MTKQEWRRFTFFKTAGSCYGERWASQLAKDLGVTKVTIYNYANANKPFTIPSDVLVKCGKLLHARQKAINETLQSNQNFIK